MHVSMSYKSSLQQLPSAWTACWMNTSQFTSTRLFIIGPVIPRVQKCTDEVVPVIQKLTQERIAHKVYLLHLDQVFLCLRDGGDFKCSV